MGVPTTFVSVWWWKERESLIMYGIYQRYLINKFKYGKTKKIEKWRNSP